MRYTVVFDHQGVTQMPGFDDLASARARQKELIRNGTPADVFREGSETTGQALIPYHEAEVEIKNEMAMFQKRQPSVKKHAYAPPPKKPKKKKKTKKKAKRRVKKKS